MPPLVVMNIAGLSRALLDSGPCPNLKSLAKEAGSISLVPVLPAVTQSMQATFITGQPPSIHGVVGNGFYDRTFQEHRFWCASGGLLESPPFWQSREGQGRHVAALFWWACRGKDLQTYLNVGPFHLSSGKTVSACRCDPSALYPEHLEPELGPFPLHHFWGPMISIDSSKWILDAFMKVLDQRKPDILLTYIPHMDYSLQRSGPGSEEATSHLEELDHLLEEPIQQARDGAFNLMILSEYGITPVTGAVSPNRTLQEEGLFQVRLLKGRSYPDLPGSRAFAICDHQIAHLYIQDPADTKRVRELMERLEGVGSILDSPDKKKAGLDHPRSGDLILLSRPDQWFDYSWWETPEAAPEYAYTVDIHSKIGYDPLELLFDPPHKQIASDPSLIRGSHGLIPEKEKDLPILIPPLSGKRVPNSLSALEVKDLIINCLE